MLILATCVLLISSFWTGEAFSAISSSCRVLGDLAVRSNAISTHNHRRGRSLYFWRTTDVEEDTQIQTGPVNGQGRTNVLRFFDDNASSEVDEKTTITNRNNSSSNKRGVAKRDLERSGNGKGGLGFLQRDVSPLTVDDEWAFSLNNIIKGEDSSADDDDSTGQEVAMMAGTGFAVLLAICGVTVLGMGVVNDFSLPPLSVTTSSVQHFFADPTSTLESVVRKVESMGPSGLLYFGVVYTIAEILAIPAIPLTASAGYLFGTVQGTSVVLVSASIAAAASFVIGRTLLRQYVEEVLEEYPKFAKIDKAIGREGFKLMVLLRLSPIFPFALSNYLYGATSVQFWPFFFGTMVGFTPGTIAYVSTGSIGKALTLDSATAYPWYAYAGGFALLAGFLKLAADVATGIIDELDEEEK